jgi:hypothetical protein
MSSAANSSHVVANLQERKNLNVFLQDVQTKRQDLRKQQQRAKIEEHNAQRRKRTLLQAFDRLDNNEVQELARIRQRIAQNAENQYEGEQDPNAGPSVGGSQPQQTLGQEIAAFDKPEVDGQQTEEMQNMTAFQEEQTQVQEVAERDQPPDEKEQIDDPHDTEHP